MGSDGVDGPVPEPAVALGGWPLAGRCWLTSGGWALLGLGIYWLSLRASWAGRVDSDGASTALQGWDLVHGHLLLRGWDFADVSFYAFELPVNGAAELVFGMGVRAAHVASALVYVVVAGLAVTVAVAGSRGQARIIRAAVVLAVMSVPLLTPEMLWALLEEPDHAGSAAFLLLAALLAARPQVLGRRLTPAVAGVLLCAGTLSDATVLFAGVPAVALTGWWRARAAGRRRSQDAVMAVAALASVPAALAVRGLEMLAGGYHMMSPDAVPEGPGRWLANIPLMWRVLRIAFGALPAGCVPGFAAAGSTGAGPAGAWLGLAGLAAAAAGIARVGRRWRRAGAAEQVLALVIVLNVAEYFLQHPDPTAAHEIAVVVVCGAVLAARLVPGRLTAAGRAGGRAAAWVSAAVAVVPLAVTASRPVAGAAAGPAPSNAASASTAPLASWLESHSYRYGLSSYWYSSVVSLQTGGRVRIRPVSLLPAPRGTAARALASVPGREDQRTWYNPARNDARFVVASVRGRDEAGYRQAFGRPAAVHRVGGQWLVLTYRANLLRQVRPAVSGPRVKIPGW